MNPIGATTSATVRSIYSPENLHSPLGNGSVAIAGFNRISPPTPLKNERPSNLGSVIGVNPTLASNNNKTQKKTRWLLCYPSGGAASSESPSPPNEEVPGSTTSTPSPTDGGFKIPNSQSNERPTSLPVALLNSSQRNGSKFNPLLIDPNERVTPSGHASHDSQGLPDPAHMDDSCIPDLSIAVTDIGVIPPPPMFSSPSPPPPPPPPLTSNQVTNGHVIVNHQVFHTNITVDGHDIADHYDEAEDEVDCDPDEDEDELEDEFDDYQYPASAGLNTRIITTVPAKEPKYNAVPLKSALKKTQNGTNGSNKSNSDQNTSSSR